MSTEARVERHIKHFKHLAQARRSGGARAAWRKELLGIARSAATDCLELNDSAPFNRLFNEDAFALTHQFIRDARAFDPTVSEANILQAMRNVWVAQSLQILLKLPLSLSPALFAYSMLYPWTDNCLDGPQRAPEQKQAFCDWLTARLRGCQAPPADARAKQVGCLVGVIESVFPRIQFPDVYLSLLAIHSAQKRSLTLQNLASTPDKMALLELTTTKGGPRSWRTPVSWTADSKRKAARLRLNTGCACNCWTTSRILRRIC